jgi:pimeloyl-ACP methyl ester carboxylesterase
MTPLVLVHGGMNSSLAWVPVLPYLEAPALAIDLPGRGKNPADLATVTLDDSVATVLKEADAAGFDRFVLVGHSLGGVTITETAFRHPERIAALVYVGALIPGPGQSAADLMGVPPLETMPVLPADTAKALFSTGLTDEQWDEHYAELVPDAPGLMNATVSGYPRETPATYLSMTQDQPVPPALARQMVTNLPQIDFRTIDDAGHTLMLSHPQLLAGILNEIAAG